MTSSHTPDSPKKPPRGSRQSRKHRPKANTKGLYQRAFKEAFLKLNPRLMLKNPVMFVVWTGTIVTALLTIDPTLFGPVLGKN
jgi:K+-transporting ATPase ATPase B chain